MQEAMCTNRNDADDDDDNDGKSIDIRIEEE